ncbi:signal peptide peptidase SppA [Portibacter marinus]|uniref:signal peptide peptidase SppA n=1 Tax=Portibacter marinus TaxID=2898660 RepID=UPI001F47DE70|nr:signal peptide peptidase SppA [Portibacter marinus]
MKSFLKSFIASCLGTLVAIGLIIFIGFIIVSSYTKQAKNNQSGILHIPFSGTIADYESNRLDLASFNFGSSGLTLWELRKKINSAAKDPNIKAIFLELKTVQMSQQMISELSVLLQNFKKEGKKIFAYSDYYEQNAYLLSTFADSIYLNPNGGVSLKGYAVFSPFFDSLLEKWDIDLHVYYAGKYKSSTEPYRLDSFSLDNQEQLRAYLSQLHSNLVTWVFQNRGIPETKVEKILNMYQDYNSEVMQANGIVDRIIYRDEVIDLLDREYDGEELVKFDQYKGSVPNTSKEVALVFAQGEIIWNNTGTGGISHGEYSDIFKKIREDDEIKTVILRIDSPGGNGYTSDLLHREVILLKEAGKKVLSSFGTYATSGAYYMACASDSIYATDNSMTGSIGVYIMLPTFEQFLAEHLEIGVDTILGSENGLAYTPLVKLTDQQEKSFQAQTERLYDLFLEKVANGRDMNVEEVNEIAQGRIWNGQDALKKNLIDELLTLDELVNRFTQDKSPQVYPEQKLSLTQELIENNLGKLANADLYQIKWMNDKVLEFQKLMEKPAPLMRVPHFINVTNQ